jgi:hypothetical protein
MVDRCFLKRRRRRPRHAAATKAKPPAGKSPGVFSTRRGKLKMVEAFPPRIEVD